MGISLAKEAMLGGREGAPRRLCTQPTRRNSVGSNEPDAAPNTRRLGLDAVVECLPGLAPARRGRVRTRSGRGRARAGQGRGRRAGAGPRPRKGHAEAAHGQGSAAPTRRRVSE